MEKNDDVVGGRALFTASGDGCTTNRSVVHGLAYRKAPPNHTGKPTIYGHACPSKKHVSAERGTFLTLSRFAGTRSLFEADPTSQQSSSFDVLRRIVSAADDRRHGYRVGKFVGTVTFGANTALPVFDLTCRPNEMIGGVRPVVRPNNGCTVPSGLGKLYRFPVTRSLFDADPLGRPGGHSGTVSPRFAYRRRCADDTLAEVARRVSPAIQYRRHPDHVPVPGPITVECESSVLANHLIFRVVLL